MSSPDDLQAGPGFFTLRSIRPSELDDGDSYAFIDPESPSLTVGEVSTPTADKTQQKSRQTLVTVVWIWCLLFVLTICMTILPFVSMALFVPIASFFALPILLLVAAAIFYIVPSLSYLLLAQTSAPPLTSLPFLPAARNYRLLLRVNLATFRWLQRAMIVFINVIPEILKTKLLYALERSRTSFIGTNIKFDSSRPNALLDVYHPNPPQFSAYLLRNGSSTFPVSDSNLFSSSLSTKAPIIIFVPAPFYGPFRTKKWMMASLGRNLARMGYCVVIPDLIAFGDTRAAGSLSTSSRQTHSRRKSSSQYSPSKIKESVQELRSVMRWAFDNGAEHGGDRSRIYLSGHGLGAHVSLLHAIQRAVVISKESIFRSYASASSNGAGASSSIAGGGKLPPVIISNGTRRVQEYGKGVWVPQAEGLLLFSPVCDVEKQVIDETELGISHLSTVRRALGPGQLPCILHSPAHILHASRDIINVELLPQKIVLFHGGYDRVVHWSQSENMKELLLGVGLEDVKARAYTTGHTGILTGLMCHERGTPLGAHLERESEPSCGFPFCRLAVRIYDHLIQSRLPSHVIDTAFPIVFLVVRVMGWLFFDSWLLTE